MLVGFRKPRGGSRRGAVRLLHGAGAGARRGRRPGAAIGRSNGMLAVWVASHAIAAFSAVARLIGPFRARAAAVHPLASSVLALLPCWRARQFVLLSTTGIRHSAAVAVHVCLRADDQRHARDGALGHAGPVDDGRSRPWMGHALCWSRCAAPLIRAVSPDLSRCWTLLCGLVLAESRSEITTIPLVPRAVDLCVRSSRRTPPSRRLAARPDVPPDPELLQDSSISTRRRSGLDRRRSRRRSSPRGKRPLADFPSASSVAALHEWQARYALLTPSEIPDWAAFKQRWTPCRT